MRNALRFALGVAVGGGGVAAYLLVVGVDDVAERALAVAPPVLAAVAALVVAESIADGIGVWASVRPLRGGLSPCRSVQFAFAGDFFDTLSPAGPVSSEPILAQFVGTATDTSYSDALGVRTAAKYLKTGTQLLVSTALAAAVLAGDPDATPVLLALGSVVALLAVATAVALRSRAVATRALVALLAPPLARLPRRSLDRAGTTAAVERFLDRLFRFRSAPRLVALIALGGVLEQALAAGTLWVALAGTGATVPLLPLVALMPLPQAASVVPVPASLGAYDGLLSGGLVLAVGVPVAAAAAAVLVVRTVSLLFWLAAGGVAAALLRGWRPGG
ncbi:MAG: uncharacterized protein family (UPF0104) [uncultured archaeon A07HB70]|nr:MAG: uncharacterized protein family (UPF0104) [uncultured archaeon A07HB70]